MYACVDILWENVQLLRLWSRTIGGGDAYINMFPEIYFVPFALFCGTWRSEYCRFTLNQSFVTMSHLATIWPYYKMNDTASASNLHSNIYFFVSPTVLWWRVLSRLFRTRLRTGRRQPTSWIRITPKVHRHPRFAYSFNFNITKF